MTAPAETIEAAPPPRPGRRESGKAERRQRIIHAARDLIRETGDAGLSMRALAARAGVSLTTPYNLFGSKRAIVLAVLDDIKEFQSRFAGLPASDPLERIFAALRIAAEFYTADPAFYRTLWAAVFDTTAEVRSAIFNPKRDAFWQRLLDDACKAGALSPDVDVELLRIQLDYVFRSVMLDWLLEKVRSEDLVVTIAYGYALMLNGVASPDWRGPLRARIVEAQAVLKASAPEPA